MDRFDRTYRLNALLSTSREAHSAASLQAELGCSRATLMRAIAELRNLLGAPLVYDTAANGYRYDGQMQPRVQLPGLWFSAAELQALLLVQNLLAGLAQGLLPEQIDALRGRIMTLLARGGVSPQRTAQVVRILPMAGRAYDPQVFRQVVAATLAGQRLDIRYLARSSGQVSERQVSPQRLVRYRDNWYLDAWCHRREALRSFAIDAVHAAQPQDEPAKALPEAELDAHFGAAYGIFAGSAPQRALLRFAPSRARWVAAEQWHPAQFGRWLEDGSYELFVPYGDPRELLLDVMRYGAEVEVLEPPALRAVVAARLRAAAELYGPAPE